MSGPPPPAGFRRQPGWLFAVVAVAVGQAGLAGHLFGPGGLLDGRPVVDGRHPLHQLHGRLGAATFRDRYSTACYDPRFQAGYPKTPVFDGGSRPAEFFLAVAGSSADPTAVYKLGVFGVCVFAPLCFAAAARGFGTCPRGATLAAAAGAVFWWTPQVRALLDAGEVDLLLAGLMGLVFLGGLVRYAADPGVTGWVVMAAASAAGWYAHPVVWLGLLPVLAGYYVAVAPRHGPAWHLGLVGVTAAGLAPNLWWLWDWGRFWWLRQPSVDDFGPLPPWADLLGGPADYATLPGPGPVGWAVLVAGLVGTGAMAHAGHRLAAGVVLLAAGLAVAVARLGATWPTLQVVAADRAAPLAAAVCVPPAAFLVSRWWACARAGPVAVVVVALLPAVLGFGGTVTAPARGALGLDLRPLRLGLTADQAEFVRGLTALTTPDARILLEDPAPPLRAGWNWTALLPTFTDRAFVGGLDPDACIEHTFCGMRDGKLNGRPFADWAASDRAAFARRYNVGWVACRTAAATAFWRADPAAREVGRFRDGTEVVLFALDRPRSFVLRGAATVARMDRRGIVLTDAVPDPGTGELILSLHHQPGFRAAPVTVRVETDKDPFDPIPLVKLWLPGPVSRVTLTWENP